MTRRLDQKGALRLEYQHNDSDTEIMVCGQMDETTLFCVEDGD